MFTYSDVSLLLVWFLTNNIQLWSVMISNDGGLVTCVRRSVSEIDLSREKGSEENYVSVMGTRCLNGAP